jgi:PP-loop superfamily ATP-utilizing enzyme
MFATKEEQQKKLSALKTLKSKKGVINAQSVKGKKCAIMYSGGMDSTVIMAELIAKGADVYPMSYDDNSLAGLFKKGPAVEKLMQHYRIYDKLTKIRMYEVEQMRGSDLFGFIPGWKMVIMWRTLWPL